MSKDVMRNVAAFVDGRNYAGQASQVTLPDLQIQTEALRAGGTDTPIEIDMGLEAMRATLTFLTVPDEVQKLFGKPDVAVTLRGALSSHDGTVRGATAELRGRMVGSNPGNWQAGSQANYVATFACHYYKLTIEGTVIHEIDIERMVRIVNGEDQLATVRDRLGI
ncbi:MAG: phage major tail tube protein [Pseudomonadales bacterium]|nr:phage major tail tube protein [Pseudomonadales bacterium]